MAEYRVRGRVFKEAARVTWSFGLDQYMCLRDVHLQFPKTEGVTAADRQVQVSRMTLTYLPTYGIQNVPVHVLHRFKDALGGGKPTTTPTTAHFQDPPADLLSLHTTTSDDEEWTRVRLPLDVLFPEGLIVCAPGELSLTYTRATSDDLDDCTSSVVLVDAAPRYAKDLMTGPAPTTVAVAAVNIKETDRAQESVHGNELRTWVYGPMIAVFPNTPAGGGPTPVSAIVGTFWYGLRALRKPEMVVLDRPGDGDVFVRPDTWDGVSGFLHVTFDGPLAALPTLTFLRSNTLKMANGMAALTLAADPYAPAPGSGDDQCHTIDIDTSSWTMAGQVW